MADEPTEEVDIPEQSRMVCKRLETTLKALDTAISNAETKAAPNAKDAARASQDLALKSQNNNGAGLSTAQKNSQDHPNTFLIELAKNFARYKLTGHPPAVDMDKEIDRKYGQPLEKKLERARELKIGQVEIAGKKMPLGAVAVNGRKDVELAKATAGLMAEGKLKLKIPQREAKFSDAQRGVPFAEAIINNWNDLKAGKPLRHAPPEKAQAPDPRNVVETYVSRKEINDTARHAQAGRDGGAVPRDAAKMGAVDYMKATGIKADATVKPGLIKDIDTIANRRAQAELEEKARRDAVEKFKTEEAARLLAQSTTAAAQRKAANPGAAAAIMAPGMQLTPNMRMGAAQVAHNNYGLEA